MIVDAVAKAMQERGVTVVVKRDYEIAGIPRDEAVVYRKAHRSYTSEQGYIGSWILSLVPWQRDSNAER